MSRPRKNQEGAEELTPEQKIEKLEAANKKLTSELKKSQKETAAIKPRDLKFEIEGEDESVQKYRFTCPKFNMDGVEYDSAEVIDQEMYEVLAKLVQMKSGIIKMIED